MHYNCLIVDDEIELAKMTCEYFEMFDISCTYVQSAEDFWDFLKCNQIDLLLLDINLDGDSGFDICKKFRKSCDIPILFISARQSDDDVLIALNIGGDDYIKKPYSLSILLAKVKVMLKRTLKNKTMPQEELVLESGDEQIKVNKGNMKITVNGREIQLKAREFRLFLYLLEHKNTIVTKEELFDEVWGDSFYSDGTLNVHIRKLREKIEEDPGNPKLIKTVWGTGYILEMKE